MAQSVGTFDYFMERDSSSMRLGKFQTSSEGEEIKINKLIDGRDVDHQGHVGKNLARLTDYKVLKTFKFTSDRKCSSVVVRAPDGQIYVYVKGSELAVKTMLRAGQEAELRAVETDEEAFAKTGLRTLYFGYKIL